MLGSVSQSVLDQYKTRHLNFPSSAELRASIISPADGKIVDTKSPVSLLQQVVSWIFLQRIDWTAVNATLEDLGQSSGSWQRLLQVNNYGPGYGARSKAQYVSVRDVTLLDCLEVLPVETPASCGDIAIVGMAAEVPDAEDCEEFWANLENQKNSCREVSANATTPGCTSTHRFAKIPRSRFDYRDFYVEDPKQRGKGRTLFTKWGNFLKNPFGFDSSFFAVSPREAISMDPQQRMMLKVAHRALENAGYAPDSTPTSARDTFACYVAAATHDYIENLRDEIDLHYCPGTRHMI